MKNIILLFVILSSIACGNEKQTDEQPQEQTQINQQTEQIEQTNQNTESINYVFKPKIFKPVNESNSNSALKKVLNDLLIVIKNKEVENLKPFLDENILVSLGRGRGWDAFSELWELDLKPKKSLVWQELKNAITLGGIFDEQNSNFYITPYLYTTFDYDPYEYAAITGKKVNIRDKPNMEGKIVTQLNYDVVKVLQDDGMFSQFQEKIGTDTHYWFHIQMADGQTGYVWGKFCRSAIDNRATFAQVRDEGWKIISFLAGD
jgi:hypothetical protein